MSELFEKYGSFKIRCIEDNHNLDITLEELYQAFKERYDKENELELPTEIKYGCYCDIETMVEPKPDHCVIDRGDYADCIYANETMKKEECEYWRPVK